MVYFVFHENNRQFRQSIKPLVLLPVLVVFCGIFNVVWLVFPFNISSCRFITSSIVFPSNRLWPGTSSAKIISVRNWMILTRKILVVSLICFPNQPPTFWDKFTLHEGNRHNSCNDYCKEFSHLVHMPFNFWAWWSFGCI